MCAGCCKNETLLNYKSYGKIFYSYIETGSGISRCADISTDEGQSACSDDCSDLTRQDVRLAYKGSPYPHKLVTKCPEFEIVINITAPPGDTAWFVCYIAFKTERIETAIIYVDENDGLTVSRSTRHLDVVCSASLHLHNCHYAAFRLMLIRSLARGLHRR